MSLPIFEFTVAEAADKGSRAYQEDAIRIWRAANGGAVTGPLLAVLSDGMGGHVSGEVASRIASTKYIEVVKAGDGYAIDKLLEQALTLSNDAINEQVRKDSALKGMGCTLVAAYISDEGLRWVSVGDSMLLRYRDGTLRRLNEDHSLGALLDRQAEANIITFDEARSDPRRRVLRSALVGTPLAVKDVSTNPDKLQHGDWVIVASDGLETLSGDEICSVLDEYLDDETHPKEVVDALLSEVKRRGVPNQDNTSIIVTRVIDPTQTATRILKRKRPLKPPPPLETTQPIAISAIPPPPQVPNSVKSAGASGASLDTEQITERATLSVTPHRIETGFAETKASRFPVLALSFACAVLAILAWYLFTAQQGIRPPSPPSGPSTNNGSP